MGTLVAGAGRSSCPLVWSPVTVLAKAPGVRLLPGTGLDTPDASLNDKGARINPRDLSDVDLGLAISDLIHAGK